MYHSRNNCLGHKIVSCLVYPVQEDIKLHYKFVNSLSIITLKTFCVYVHKVQLLANKR